MPQLFNSAEDIIRAFELGRQAKQQQEQLTLKQQQDQRDYEEGKRQFDERLKQQEAELKNQMDVQKALQAIHIAELRSGRLKEYSMYGGPKQTVRQDWASINAPEVQQNVTHKLFPESTLPGLASVTIGANEYPEVPMQERMRQDSLEQAKSLKEAELASRALIASETNAARSAQVADTNAVRELIANSNNETRRLIAGMIAAGKSGSGDRRDRTAVANEAKGLRQDKMYNNLLGAAEAYNWVKSTKPDPKAPGVDDMRLIYMWIKSLDNSVVKPSEIETLQTAGASKLKQLGLKVDRLTKDTVLLPPQTRAAIISDISRNFQTKTEQWNKNVAAARARAAYTIGEDVPLEVFKSMVYGTDMDKFQEESLPPAVGGVTPVRRVK